MCRQKWKVRSGKKAKNILVGQHIITSVLDNNLNNLNQPISIHHHAKKERKNVSVLSGKRETGTLCSRGRESSGQSIWFFVVVAGCTHLTKYFHIYFRLAWDSDNVFVTRECMWFFFFFLEWAVSLMVAKLSLPNFYLQCLSGQFVHLNGQFVQWPFMHFGQCGRGRSVIPFCRCRCRSPPPQTLFASCSVH